MTARTSKPFEKTAQFYWVFVVLAATLYLITSFPGILGTLFTLALLAVMAAVIRSVEGGSDARERDGSDGAPLGGATEVVTLGSSIKGRLGGRRPVRMPRRPKRFQSIFIDAHCVVSTPTCGPCLGGYMGILAAGERCVSSTNRNFVGRMGDPTSEVYLASPAVAAASAVAGHIALPQDLS